MGGVVVSFLAWLVFIGLDAGRFGWSHAPAWAQVLGGLMMVAVFGPGPISVDKR